MSALEDESLSALERYLKPATTIALLGSSGVGKSTIVNRLLGREMQRVAPVRESDGTGRHATASRQLIVLPSGALLIDTPGMRELQPWADESAVEGAFADITETARHCRFGDCSHSHEPGCAVIAAIAVGMLDAARLDHYHHLAREAAFEERKRDKAAAAQQKRRGSAWRRLTGHGNESGSGNRCEGCGGCGRVRVGCRGSLGRESVSQTRLRSDSVQRRHPDVAAELVLSRDEESGDDGGGTARRSPSPSGVVKMVHGKYVAFRAAGLWIDSDRIQTPESVTFEEKIKNGVVGRPSGRPVGVRQPFGDRYHPLLFHRVAGREWRDGDGAVLNKGYPPVGPTRGADVGFVRCQTCTRSRVSTSRSHTSGLLFDQYMSVVRESDYFAGITDLAGRTTLCAQSNPAPIPCGTRLAPQ